MRLIIFTMSFAVWKLPRLTALEGTGTCLSEKGKMQPGHRRTGATAMRVYQLPGKQKLHCQLSIVAWVRLTAENNFDNSNGVFWVCGYVVYLRSGWALLTNVQKATEPSAVQRSGSWRRSGNHLPKYKLSQWWHCFMPKNLTCSAACYWRFGFIRQEVGNGQAGRYTSCTNTVTNICAQGITCYISHLFQAPLSNCLLFLL